MRISSPTQTTISKTALEFLRRNNALGQIPVPIEEIVEFRLSIQITPLPGLERDFDTLAFISSDLKTITVDEAMLTSQYHRYRFSLAHELGHMVLHSAMLAAHHVESIEQYRAFFTAFDPVLYSDLEAQANAFAGCVFAPAPELVSRFSKAAARLKPAGLRLNYKSMPYVVRVLADEFEVAWETMAIRVREEHLGTSFTW